jgi:hypothetical protein
MIIPTLDQTEGIWIARTNGHGYHYVQEIFSEEIAGERHHRANCYLLITRGSLEPEISDGLAPSQRIWDATQRYRQVHS